MCNPLALAGLGLSIAGGIYNARTQQNYVNAQNQAQRQAYEQSAQARAAERERQAKLSKEQRKTWDEALKGVAPDEREKIQNEASERFVADVDNAPPDITQTPLLSGQEYADPAVTREVAAQTATQSAQARARIAALARMSSYGTANTANANALGQSGDYIDTINGMRKGSMGAMNVEANIPATQVFPSTSILGDIMSGVGGLAAMGGGQMSGGMPLFGGFGRTVQTTAPQTGAPGRPMSILPPNLF